MTEPAPEEVARIEEVARAIDPFAFDWGEPGSTRIEMQRKAREAAQRVLKTAALRSARAAALEEAARVAETLSYAHDIEWWMQATKKDVSADACRQVATAIRALDRPIEKKEK